MWFSCFGKSTLTCQGPVAVYNYLMLLCQLSRTSNSSGGKVCNYSGRTIIIDIHFYDILLFWKIYLALSPSKELSCELKAGCQSVTRQHSIWCTCASTINRTSNPYSSPQNSQQNNQRGPSILFWDKDKLYIPQKEFKLYCKWNSGDKPPGLEQIGKIIRSI